MTLTTAETSSAIPTLPSGLTEAEAADRRQRGLGNHVRLDTSRTYLQIVRANVLTFLNLVLFGIGIVLVLLGLYTDAFLSVGIALMNVIVGLSQELRAKRALDRIALLTRPKATLVREGRQQTVDPAAIVVGDILLAHSGDQIVVDGQVIDGRMDVDESLLTGESDLIPKRPGDPVYSGSFCVTGSACYEAQKVGAESVASKLTAGARAFRQIKTPLQQDVDFIVRLLLALTTFMAILFGLTAVVMNQPLTDTARIAAVVAGLIPNGLFFMTSVAYAMGAVRMAGRGALIQQSNAVESMSNINILCLDKTGTLTANRIHLNQIAAYSGTEDDLRRIIGIYAASVTAGNRTIAALHESLGGQRRRFIEEVPFSSARKWSALSFDQPDLKGVFVLGAPESLRPHLNERADLGTVPLEWASKGLRVLLIAHHPELTPLYNSLEQPQLPPDLIPLGIISFRDELRAEAESTLKDFAQAGIRLKIISGDNPQTVEALARQAGLSGDIRLYAGPDLDEMTPSRFVEAAEDGTIFGRITPQQKERLVDALRSRGHYVAMIGDGVNDVLSLKKSHIGIAMQSGSQATRGVADIVLLNDSFAALPAAFREGQRIVSGMVDIMRLFLSRVVYQTLIIIGVAIVGIGFPITPVHQSLLSLFTVGIPTLALAAWARPGVPQGKLIGSVIRFALPAGATLALVGIILYVGVYASIFTAQTGIDTLNPNAFQTATTTLVQASSGQSTSALIAAAEQAALLHARTMLTVFTTLAGLLLILFAEPPTAFWTGGDLLAGDWRPTLMAALLFVIFIVILAVPSLRDFFELAPLSISDSLLIAALLVGWTLLIRALWRWRVFDRFLRLA